MDDFAILVNSCDSYSDAWYPFFRILEKAWPEVRNHHLYLNTETKKYEDSFFNVITINQRSNTKLSWGQRLKNCLVEIPEELVLFLLEDFFFDSINNEQVLEAFNIISKHDNIDSVSLITTYDCKSNISFFKDNHSFVCREKNVYFKLNASPTFFRKAFLLKYTFSKDSPWYWEFFGSVRTWHSNRLHLGKSESCGSICSYDIEHGGAIHRGKWVGVSTRRILSKYKIEIDLYKRGVIEDWLVSNPEKPKHNILTILRNKILFLLNYAISFLIR